jgi:hypothetical protein
VIHTDTQCRCAVCRARKSRCIARNVGSCERCVEKGEDCDLYAAQASASPATSSNATVNGQQKDKRPPGSGHGDKDAGTPSSMSIAQVRVLGRSTDSNISLAASEAVQKSFEKSPTDSRSDHRPQSPGEPSPVPSVEPEDAILIVEDFDRTRTFRL